MKKHLIALAFLVLLPACSSEQGPPPKLEMGASSKIGLDIAQLNLIDHSGVQPANSPYNSNHFHPTIVEAVHQFASDRLKPVGISGQGSFIIKDASLVTQALPTGHGFDFWFKRQQASKYVAHVEVDIEVETKGHTGYAIATAQATRTETLPENPSEEERQKAYFDILNGLMRDLGQSIESGLDEHMRDFIVRSPVSP